MIMPTKTDKVVILARGLGTRMREADDTAGLDASQAAIAHTGLKALIPIDRPFLDYVLTALGDAGYRRICLVIGPDHDAVRDYYTRQVRAERLEFAFAVQQEPKGTADALLAAETFAGDDPFIVINSDNYYPVEALRGLHDQAGSATALFEWQSMVAGSNVSEARLRHFAIGLVNDEGLLTRIVEKPDEDTWASLPRPVWMSMNCWRFQPIIFDAARSIDPSPRGEFEIPDAVQYAIDELAEPFHAVRVHAPVLDLTSRKDVAPVAERLAVAEVRL